MPGKRYAHLRKLYFITEDRILVHLLDFIGREGELSQPDDITQFGIAGAIGLGRSTGWKGGRRLGVGERPRPLPEYASLPDVMAPVARGVFAAASYKPLLRLRLVDLT